MGSSDFIPEDFQEFSHFPSIILAKFDGDGTLIAVNDGMEKILGLHSYELIGKKFPSFMFPEDQLKFSIGDCVQRSRFRHKDGSCKWMNWISRSQGTHTLVMGRDVSDTIESEDALRLATKRLSQAVQIGGVGVFEWRPETDEIIPDEMTEKIHGFEPGKSFRTGTAMGSMLHRDDIMPVGQIVMNAVEKKIPYNVEFRIIRKDGELRWIKCSGVPFDDRPLRVIGTLIDVTDQKQKLEEQNLLSEISDKLSSSFDYQANVEHVLEHLTDSFCDQAIVDHFCDESTVNRICVSRQENGEYKVVKKTFPNLPFQDKNPLIAKLLNGEVVHVEDSDLAMDKLSEHYPAEFLENVRTENAKSDLVILLKRHEHIMGVLVLTLNKNNPRVYQKSDIELSKEISYRISVAMENSLLYLSSQEAVHARDEFLSVASHELKTPLQSLMLQNEMLARHLETCEDEGLNRKFLNKSLEGDRRQLKRITRLIEDMLDITRIQNSRMSIDMEPVDFVELLENVIDRMRPAFENLGIKLTLKTDEKITVKVDSFRIEQVISNILTNALKYGDKKPIDVCAKVENCMLCFSVKDQGHGIHKEDQERIFLRFERASSKNEVTGLGLGLYICQKIVEAHDGTILIESETDKGSTFTVKLPLRN